MHSLESEYLQAGKGCVDATTVSHAIAMERGNPFSLHEELRIALYISVAAITTGVGIVLKNNLDRIGPLALTVTLSLLAACCYATAIRTRLQGRSRTVGGDYVLVLGALLMSLDLGYAESQFHWLGDAWSWHLLILALLHAVTAYALNSPLVLSVSLASLAGWFGIHTRIEQWFYADRLMWRSGLQGLNCAVVIAVWRFMHQRLQGPQSFLPVMEHFAFNTGFVGALILCGNNGTRWTGALMLLMLGAIALYNGLRDHREAFIVYGIACSTLGMCVIETRVVDDSLLLIMMMFVTIVAATLTLWHFHAQLKRETM